MIHTFRRDIKNFLIVFSFGLIPAVICQFFARQPVDRYIHITSFRYGKDPSVIRCNRGDKLHLTFSTDDTGHSFFLEEFDIDAKVSPARDQVEVFKASDPTARSILTRELVFTARHPGILNFLVTSQQNFIFPLFIFNNYLYIYFSQEVNPPDLYVSYQYHISKKGLPHAAFSIRGYGQGI